MKNKELNAVDNLFRKGMEAEETNPPSASWAQMEALLDAQNAKPKRRKFAVFYWAAAALLPFLIFGLWFWNQNPATINIAKTDSVKIKSSPKSNENSSTENTDSPSGDNQNRSELPSEKGDKLNDKSLVNRVKRGKTTRLNESFPLPDLVLLEDKMVQNPQLDENQNIDLETFAKRELEGKKIEPQIIDNNLSEVAVIEFRPSEKMNSPEDQIASVEWRKDKNQKISLGERLANLKSGQIKNFPTIGDAKEELFALITNTK